MKKGTLQDIEIFISTQSAMQFAMIVVDEKSKNKEDLYACWAKDYNEPIEVVQSRLVLSCLKKYEEHIKAYRGFNECGKVFVLNRVEKVLYFLCDKTNGIARLITQYNPLNLDVFETSINSDYLFGQINKNQWDVSLSEADLRRELDELLTSTNPHYPPN